MKTTTAKKSKKSDKQAEAPVTEVKVAAPRSYEALVILKPILDVDNSDNVLKSIEDTVENLKGKIVKKDKLGRKRLAYEINKFKDGFVTTYQLTLDPGSLTALKRAAQLNEDILRLVLVNREGIDLNDATIYGRDRGEHRGDRGEFRGERPEREFRPRGPRPDGFRPEGGFRSEGPRPEGGFRPEGPRPERAPAE